MQSEVTGKGAPVVLVGGGLTGWKSWEPFVEILTAEQRKVIRVQLISVQYGLESWPLPADFSIKTESTALAKTLDALDCTYPVDVVAWSYGAHTCLDLALDQPERFRTLTLIEPPAMWVLRETGGFDDQARQAAAFFETLHGDITEDMLEEFVENAGLVSPGQSARDLPLWNGWVPFRQSLRNCPSVVSHRDDLQRLQNLEAPVLLVKGTGSTPWLHRIIDELSAHLPESHIAEFEGGHAPHLVSREEFLSTLRSFQEMRQ